MTRGLRIIGHVELQFYEIILVKLCKANGNACMRVTNHAVNLKQASKHTHLLSYLFLSASVKDSFLILVSETAGDSFVEIQDVITFVGVRTSACWFDCKVQLCKRDLLQKAAPVHTWGTGARCSQKSLLSDICSARWKQGLLKSGGTHVNKHTNKCNAWKCKNGIKLGV